MNLNDNDKVQIIELIKAGEKLPKEFIYKLFSDEEDVFLSGTEEKKTQQILYFENIMRNIEWRILLGKMLWQQCIRLIFTT